MNLFQSPIDSYLQYSENEIHRTIFLNFPVMFPTNVCYNFKKYNEKDRSPCLVKKYAGSKSF